MCKWFLKRKHKGKRRALVFMNYEYLYYSYQNRYGIRPDIERLKRELTAKYDIVRFEMYGNFSTPEVCNEREALENLADALIETDNRSQSKTANINDLVMLDRIYRAVDSTKKVDVIVVFTGNKYLCPLFEHLMQRKKKKVVLYCVDRAYAEELCHAVAETVFLPPSGEIYYRYRQMLIENMAYVAEHHDILPTFRKTAEIVAKYNQASSEVMTEVLGRLIDERYIYRREHQIEIGTTIRVLAADWDRLIREGIWDPESECSIDYDVKLQ